jgi:hypothetical protein
MLSTHKIGDKFVPHLLSTLLNLALGAALILAPSLTNIGSGSMYDSAFADKGGNGKGGGSNGNGGNGNGGNGNGGNGNGGNGNGGGNSSRTGNGAVKAKHAKALKKRKVTLNASYSSAVVGLHAAPDANAAIAAAQRLLTDAQAALNAALADPKFNLAIFPRLEKAVANAQAAYARAMNNAAVADQAAED